MTSLRLRKRESAGEGIRRVLLAELEAARQELVDAAESARALHNVRRRLKRLRATCDIASSGWRSRARAHDRELRDIALLLSRHREIDALTELITREAAAAGLDDMAGLISAVRLHQAAGPTVGDRKRELAAARRRLNSLRRQIAAHADEPITRGDCHQRFRKSYKRTRGAYRQARKQPSEEAIHRWRQQAKVLLNQSRLLAGWGAPALAEFRRELTRLDDSLGCARDCAFLASILRGLPAAEKPLRAHLSLRGRLEMVARRELMNAFRRGGRIYRRRSRAFVRRMLG